MKKASVLVRSLVLLGVLAMAAFAALPATAASDSLPTIKSMKVSVWPEYDDPRILVIYQGEFNNASTFPQVVKFPAPMGSEISQVCALQKPKDEHLCQLYDTLTEKDNIAVSYTLPIPTYFLEYYWDGISAGPSKSFSFKYVAPYAVDRLDIDLQQPLKATDFKAPAGYTNITTDSKGMKYYNYSYSNVTPGQVISLDTAYTKSDSKPSVAKQGSAAAGGGINSSLLLGVAAVAAILLVVGFMVFRRKPAPVPARAVQARRAARFEAQRRAEERRAPRQEPMRQERPAPTGPVRPARPVQPAQPMQAARQNAGSGSTFCSKCGAKLEAEDVFCTGCGQKSRRSA